MSSIVHYLENEGIGVSVCSHTIAETGPRMNEIENRFIMFTNNIISEAEKNRVALKTIAFHQQKKKKDSETYRHIPGRQVS